MRLFILFILMFFIMSCTDQMDGEKAAKQYCNCMKQNNSEKQYGYAYTICNAEMAKKYRFYRIFYIDTKDGEFEISEATSDSTKKFISEFMQYKNEHNCPI